MADARYSLAGKRVYVAGHGGMVGSALCRRLANEPCTLLTASRQQVDLLRQEAVEAWLRHARPQAVFVAAATVGGIHANSSRPAEFLYENVTIAANVIHGAYRAGVEKLLFLGSSCIYPRLAPQPMAEAALLTGLPEPTNEPYAIAKIAGIKLCQSYRRQYGCDFISAMPTNLFGPGDNYSLSQGHVVAALIARIHQARVDGAAEVALWGSGSPLREVMAVDDLADALLFLMTHYSDESHINVGSGIEISILDLAREIAAVIGFDGRFSCDRSKPDGAPRKLMDSTRLTALGWRARIPLREGLQQAYHAFLDGRGRLTGRP